MEYKFYCKYCNQKLAVTDDMAGGLIDCPACKKELRVPPPETEKEKEEPSSTTIYVSSSELRYDSVESIPGKKYEEEDICPECGSKIRKGGVVCTECGYHVKIGLKIIIN